MYLHGGIHVYSCTYSSSFFQNTSRYTVVLVQCMHQRYSHRWTHIHIYVYACFHSSSRQSHTVQARLRTSFHHSHTNVTWYKWIPQYNTHTHTPLGLCVGLRACGGDKDLGTWVLPELPLAALTLHHQQRDYEGTQTRKPQPHTERPLARHHTAL